MIKTPTTKPRVPRAARLTLLACLFAATFTDPAHARQPATAGAGSPPKSEAAAEPSHLLALLVDGARQRLGLLRDLFEHQ